MVFDFNRLSNSIMLQGTKPFEIDIHRYLLSNTTDFMLNSHSTGWIGGTQRSVEVYTTQNGFILKVEDGGTFFISSQGDSVGKLGSDDIELNELDREIILGPAFVLALALRGVWSLHASAALFQEKVIVFLGESGYGKSTLAAYLGRSDWQRVADDILPVTCNASGILAWPHFPQLKLSLEEQPALNLPESLPLDMICLVSPEPADEMPQIEPLTKTDAVTALLSHTAGTRLFWPELLSKHLAFCAQAGGQLPAYRLTYPHRRDALPLVREMLEALC